MIVAELIDKILNDLGEPSDGTGFWTREDVRSAISELQREICWETGNLLVTLDAINPTIDTFEISLGVEYIDVYAAYCNDVPIFCYTEDQLREYDTDWKTREGNPVRGIVKDVAGSNTVGLYPLPDVATDEVVLRILKVADEIIAELTEAGDASNQLSGWVLYGVNANNVDTDKLYWTLADVTGTRTVKLYKDSAKAAGDLVAQGSLVGDGAITLTAQNSSGLTGSVTVAWTIDDSDSANILTLDTIEIPTQDIPVLKNGVKGFVLALEKNGKSVQRSTMFNGLYMKGINGIKRRLSKKRDGTFRVMNVRPVVGTRLRPFYPWER